MRTSYIRTFYPLPEIGNNRLLIAPVNRRRVAIAFQARNNSAYIFTKPGNIDPAVLIDVPGDGMIVSDSAIWLFQGEKVCPQNEFWAGMATGADASLTVWEVTDESIGDDVTQREHVYQETILRLLEKLRRER